jgi:hypothetical protein
MSGQVASALLMLEEAMHSMVQWPALVLLGASLALIAPIAQSAESAPVIDPAPVIDNEEVTVWDIRLEKGASARATPHELDSVIMFLEGGRIRTVAAGGNASIAMRAFGDAQFIPRGTDASQTLLSDGSAHEVMIALKDFHVPAVANTTGLPAAFPRPGSVKVLDNDRVVVWHYSWTRGAPTPMHFHDKDVVVAYRYDGTLESVAPGGTTVINPYKSGDIRFNKANRSHYEELTTDRQSAVMMELK